MIILEDSTGLTLKHTIGNHNYIRLTNYGSIMFWSGKVVVHTRYTTKPYVDMTFNEFSDLMIELTSRIKGKEAKDFAKTIGNPK